MLPFLEHLETRKAPPVNTDDPWGVGPVAGMGDIVPVAAEQPHLAATNQIRIASLRPAPARGRTGRDAQTTRRKMSYSTLDATPGASKHSTSESIHELDRRKHPIASTPDRRPI